MRLVEETCWMGSINWLTELTIFFQSLQPNPPLENGNSNQEELELVSNSNAKEVENGDRSLDTDNVRKEEEMCQSSHSNGAHKESENGTKAVTVPEFSSSPLSDSDNVSMIKNGDYF